MGGGSSVVRGNILYMPLGAALECDKAALWQPSLFRIVFLVLRCPAVSVCPYLSASDCISELASVPLDLRMFLYI